MPISASSPKPPRSSARRLAFSLARAAAAALLGFLFGYYVLTALAPGGSGLDLSGLTWADGLLALCAVALITAAGALAATSFSAAALGRLLKSEGPATREEIGNVRLQAMVSALAGLLLLAPPVAASLGLDAGWSYLALLAVLAWQSLINLRLYRDGDEMIRDLMVRSGAVCFWGLQGLLFVYAAAERLGLVAPLSAWSMLAVLFAAYLIVSFVLTVRRGLA